jgi:hypothetical protein
MRQLLLLLLGCGGCGTDAVPPVESVPFVVVHKLEGHERHIGIDRPAYDQLAAGIAPTDFTVTMRTTYTIGIPDAIFIREYRDGVWYSSSPSPDVIVDDTPRIESACDNCHATHAESLGWFTRPAALEAAPLGAIVHIDCPEAGTTPCDVAVYRDLQF